MAYHGIIISIIPSFLNSSISAHRIRELIDFPKEVHIPQSNELDVFVEDGFSVEMKDVDFSYINGTQVISDSAFCARPGEIVAWVWSSGEGKTTMIRLILGLVRPKKGTVSIRWNLPQYKITDGYGEKTAAADLDHLEVEIFHMVKEDAADEEIIE